MTLVFRFFSVFVFCLVCALPAQPSQLVLILSDNNGGAYSEFSEYLKRQLAGSAWQISAVVLPQQIATTMKIESANVWLTLGEEATRAALASGKAPALIATLLSQYAFERILSEQSYRPPGLLTAVVLNQPLQRQLLFVEKLLPEKKRVGFLLGPESRMLASQIHQQALDQGFSAEFEEANSDNAVIPAATRLLRRSDVLVALPDGKVFTRNNLRPLLIASYRLQRPLVAYSPTMVGAGATAALYTAPTQFAQQVAQILLQNSRPSLIQYPETFTLSYNRQAARSLGLNLPDETITMRALSGKEDTP